MTQLSAVLNSPSPPSLEETAGLVLEEFTNSGKDNESLRNFIAIHSGTPGGNRSQATDAISTAFQYLLNRGLLAPTVQEGWYIATKQGREIRTAARLKAYLDEERDKTSTAYQRAASDIAEMKREAASDIAKAIEETKKEAESILNLARQTAQGVSLRDVQDQFAHAAKHCLTGIWIWASLSVVFCFALVVTVIGFVTWWEPHFETATDKGVASGFTIYHTVLRVTILTAIAALAAFCLKVLRAQLHLREQNLHRQRVANSMAAFLGAATSSDQRDLLLGRLTEAITSFGNSGLLADDDSMSPTKVILESVQRGLSPKS